MIEVPILDVIGTEAGRVSCGIVKEAKYSKKIFRFLNGLKEVVGAVM